MEGIDRFVSQAMNRQLLLPEEELDLARRVKEFNDAAAREKLIVSHLPLVISYARQKARGATHFEDLVQRGNEALVIAADKFDYTVGVRFSTYALWWIKEGVRVEGFHHAHGVYVPLSVYSKKALLNRTAKELAAELGRTPTTKEVAAKADISVKVAERYIGPLNLKTFSTETPMTHGDVVSDSVLGDTLADGCYLTPEQHAEAVTELRAAKNRIAEIDHRISNGFRLSQRNQDIFRLYYGLGGVKRHTLEEIKQIHNTITRQRIQQILARIWERLSPGLVHATPTNNPLLDDLSRVEYLEDLVEMTEPR